MMLPATEKSLEQHEVASNSMDEQTLEKRDSMSLFERLLLQNGSPETSGQQ
jgi:hypothetical protein